MEAVASWTLSKEREEGIKQAAPAHVKSRDGPGMASAEAAPVSQGEILQIDSPPPNHGHVKLVSFVGSEDEVCPARGWADTVATSHVATAEVVPSADPFLQLLRALRMDDEEDVAVFRVAGVRNTRDLLELEEDDLKHDDLMLMPLMTRKKLQRFVSTGDDFLQVGHEAPLACSPLLSIPSESILHVGQMHPTNHPTRVAA